MQSIFDSNAADWCLPSTSTEQKPCQAVNQDEKMSDVTPMNPTPEIDEALAKNLEMLAIFSIRSGSVGMDKVDLPLTNRDIDAACQGDQNAKKKLIAFGHHLWTVMHK